MVSLDKKALLPLLVAAVLLANSCCAESGNLETLKDGLANGKELAEALKEENFSGSLGKFMVKASRFLKVVSPALSLILAAIPGGESELESGFREVNHRLSLLSGEMKAVVGVIKWESAKAAYTSSKLKISTLAKIYKEVMNPINSARIRHNATVEFMDEFQSGGPTGRGAFSNLFDAMVGHGEYLTENLADACVVFTKKHRRQVQNFVRGLAGLVIQGAEMEIAYYTMRGDPVYAAHKSRRWETRLQEMNAKMEAVDSQCENGWHEQSKEDMDRLLESNRDESNEQFKESLYDLLKEKFYWRTWFVAVYDEFCSHSWISSGDYGWNKQKNKQKVSQIGGHERLCSHGRSTVIASSEPTGFNADWDTKGRSALNRIDRSVAYAWAGDWYNLLANEIRHYNFKFIGIICTDCHLSYTSFDRVITQTLTYGSRYCIRYCSDHKRKPMKAIMFY